MSNGLIFILARHIIIIIIVIIGVAFGAQKLRQFSDLIDLHRLWQASSMECVIANSTVNNVGELVWLYLAADLACFIGEKLCYGQFTFKYGFLRRWTNFSNAAGQYAMLLNLFCDLIFFTHLLFTATLFSALSRISFISFLSMFL